MQTNKGATSGGHLARREGALNALAVTGIEDSAADSNNRCLDIRAQAQGGLM